MSAFYLKSGGFRQHKVDILSRKKLWLGAVFGVACISFGYGVLVGKYNFPPYYLIIAVKNSIIFTDNEGGRSSHYTHKKSFFDLHGRRDYEVVFVGDSITQGGDWYELFPEVRAANRGIDGDTASGILNRLDSILSTGAEKAFIMVGINDLRASVAVEDIFYDYVAIVDACVSSGMTVYVQSTLYGADARYAPLIGRITRLNDLLQSFSARKEKVFFIDLNLRLSQNSYLVSSYTSDGLHLNGAAYGVWQDTIHSMVVN